MVTPICNSLICNSRTHTRNVTTNWLFS